MRTLVLFCLLAVSAWAAPAPFPAHPPRKVQASDLPGEWIMHWPYVKYQWVIHRDGSYVERSVGGGNYLFGHWKLEGDLLTLEEGYISTNDLGGIEWRLSVQWTVRLRYIHRDRLEGEASFRDNHSFRAVFTRKKEAW